MGLVGHAPDQQREELELGGGELDLLARDLDQAAAAAGRLVQGDVEDRKADVGGLALELVAGLGGRAQAVAGPQRGADGGIDRDRGQVLAVGEEVEADLADVQAIAGGERGRARERVIVDVGAVGRAEVAHRPRLLDRIPRHVGVVARDRALEHADPGALELAADERPGVDGVGAAPRVDEHRADRPRRGGEDLLGHHAHGVRDLVPAVLAQQAGFDGALATDRALHRAGA